MNGRTRGRAFQRVKRLGIRALEDKVHFEACGNVRSPILHTYKRKGKMGNSRNMPRES